MNDNVFRLILLVVVIPQSVVSFVYLTQARAAGSVFRHRREGVPLSVLLALSYIAYCAGLVTYLIEPRWMVWGSGPGFANWARWLGAGPLVVGAALIVTSLRTFRHNFAFSVSPHEGSRLITTGPYHWVRHPLYSAFLVQSVGVSLVMASWFVGLMAALTWILLVYRIRLEEEQLVERFGDEYRDYMKRTGRFLPRSLK